MFQGAYDYFLYRILSVPESEISSSLGGLRDLYELLRNVSRPPGAEPLTVDHVVLFCSQPDKRLVNRNLFSHFWNVCCTIGLENFQYRFSRTKSWFLGIPEKTSNLQVFGTSLVIPQTVLLQVNYSGRPLLRLEQNPGKFICSEKQGSIVKMLWDIFAFSLFIRFSSTPFFVDWTSVVRARAVVSAVFGPLCFWTICESVARVAISRAVLLAGFASGFLRWVPCWYHRNSSGSHLSEPKFLHRSPHGFQHTVKLQIQPTKSHRVQPSVLEANVYPFDHYHVVVYSQTFLVSFFQVTSSKWLVTTTWSGN